MLRIPLPHDFLFPSSISPPLAEMKIRWDGFDPGKGGMRTLNSPRFGMTRNGGARPHGGIDLAAKSGTPILAVADGVIEDVRSTDPAYGVDILLKFRPAEAWARFLASAGNKDDDGVLFARMLISRTPL